MPRYLAPRGMADAEDVINQAANNGTSWIDDLGRVINTAQQAADTIDAVEQIWEDTPPPQTQNYAPPNDPSTLPPIDVSVGQQETDYTPWLIGGGIALAVLVGYMVMK